MRTSRSIHLRKNEVIQVQFIPYSFELEYTPLLPELCNIVLEYCRPKKIIYKWAFLQKKNGSIIDVDRCETAYPCIIRNREGRRVQCIVTVFDYGELNMVKWEIKQ